ncbi:MAG: hypothetical protein AAGJ35_12670, partial [Myxococcota bacterium]
MSGFVSQCLSACLSVVLLGSLSGFSMAASDKVKDVLKMAVLVGSNHAARGRKALRFSYLDVKRTARTLQDLGGFSKKHMFMFFDASPKQVIDKIKWSLQRMQSQKESV